MAIFQNLKNKLNDNGHTSPPVPPAPPARAHSVPTNIVRTHDVATEASAVKNVNGAYFSNWGIYSRKYFPQQAPVECLTHIFYAFADVKPETGEVFLTDLWADEQIHYDNDSWSDTGNNLYGNFKAFLLLKKKHRHLKLLLSIGGWTFGPHFAPMAKDPAKRAKFVATCLNLLENNGLDGIDIDWEYPDNDAQAKDYVSLLREMRNGLTNHQNKKKEKVPYQLTIAAPCGQDQYNKLHIAEMNQYLDFWNLMAYDFAGSWSNVTGHQSNLYGAAPSIDAAVKHYVAKGAPANKLVLGLPLYGRCFENTDGPGKPYKGIGQGSWEAGNYDYKMLPLKGAQEKLDTKIGASWSYDSSKRELVTYDTPALAKIKCDWIKANGLRGTMFWELSGDADAKNGGVDRSLVLICAKALGNLDNSINHISYPGSKWDNVKKGI